VTSYVYVSDPLKVPKVEDEEEYEDEFQKNCEKVS
jgi:hypothetical protein